MVSKCTFFLFCSVIMGALFCCSPIQKQSEYLNFEELDIAIQDTLRSIQSLSNKDFSFDDINLIDFTGDFVFISKQDKLRGWMYHSEIVNIKTGWNCEFKANKPRPIIIKDNYIYLPIDYNIFLNSNLTNTKFEVYLIK